MDLGGIVGIIKSVVQYVVESAVLKASAVGLALPRFSCISANGGYAYNTAQVSVRAQRGLNLLTYSTLTPPSLGFDSDEKTKAISKNRS